MNLDQHHAHSHLPQNIRLIDYEKICDAKGTRLVRFGKFAGFAGMIDMLRILGERLLVLGYSTPFLVRTHTARCTSCIP